MLSPLIPLKKHRLMKSTPPSNAFTLIELLILVGIIGVVAAIIVPALDRAREAARMSVDASNIRQIGQASLIYARDNQGQLPPVGGYGYRGLTQHGELGPMGSQTPSLHAIAAALARSGGLNDASIWISSSDEHREISPAPQTTVLTGTTTKTLTPTFAESGLSIAYIAGLNTSFRSDIPVAFTRGLNKSGGNGLWIATSGHGVYGSEGGFIVFLGGQVGFYKDVGTTAQTGIFVDFDNGASTNIMGNALPAYPASQRFYSDPMGPSGSPSGN